MKKELNDLNLSPEDVAQANQKSKGLIGVGKEGVPFLHYLLNNAKKAGYHNIYIIIGEHDTLFQETYGQAMSNNKFNGLLISYARQIVPADRTKPFGTADAVFQALEQYPQLKEESFTVCNSDNLYSVDALRHLRETEAHNALLAYDRDSLEYPEERIARFALMRLDDENYLTDIIEKPNQNVVEKYRDKQGALRVSMNIFKFSGPLFHPFLKDCPVHPERQEKELPTALLNLVNSLPKSTLAIPIAEHVIDLTSKSDISLVRAYLDENYPNLIW
jgi:glucose-1-phosphate adenylyltransferase